MASHPRSPRPRRRPSQRTAARRRLAVLALVAAAGAAVAIGALGLDDRSAGRAAPAAAAGTTAPKPPATAPETVTPAAATPSPPPISARERARRRERAARTAAIDRALRRTPYIRRAGAQTRSVALTFDDGPGVFTPRILEILDAYNAKATFFTVGNEVGDEPALLRRAAAAGHAIGDHTWNHADLTGLSGPAVADEIQSAAGAVRRAGLPRPRLFRPPYGAFDRRTLAKAREQRMLTVLWTIDTSDYRVRDAGTIAQTVLSQARPGAIILMHDAGGDRSATVRALPGIVRGLRSRGFRLVTVPRLLVTNPPGRDQGPAGSGGYG